MTADKVDSTPEPEPITVDPSDPFLSTTQVARLFGNTTETVRVWIESGILSAVQVRGRWRVRQSEVTRLVNEKYGDDT